MSTIHVRIDERTKRQSSKILDELGLDMSHAITVYLRHIIAKNGIPFSVLTRNGMTAEEERQILQAAQETKKGKNVTRAMNAKQVTTFLDSLK